MAAIFDYWRWPPFMRSNMAENAPCHLMQIFWVFWCSFLPPPPPPVCTLITVYGSHTGINVCAHCPLHLPKKVTEKPSVNHIGSFDEPPICVLSWPYFLGWECLSHIVATCDFASQKLEYVTVAPQCQGHWRPQYIRATFPPLRHFSKRHRLTDTVYQLGNKPRSKQSQRLCLVCPPWQEQYLLIVSF